MKAKGVVGVIIAWVLIYVVFVFLIAHFRSQPFLTADNLELMMRQAIIVGLGAIGMSYVIMTGGIDLSPGSTIAVTTVCVALVLKLTNNPFLGIGVSIVVGLVAGFINGLLVAKLKVGPFIVTLASMLIFRGVAKGFAHEQTVGSVPDTWIQVFTASLDRKHGEAWQLIPKGAWVWIVLLLVMTFILHRTVFGRNVVAVGSNEKTARLCGINVTAVKIGVYTICGLFAGIAGLMQVSRIGIGDPIISAGDELKMIAAVVIGGGSLLGGEGNLIGAAFGTLIMTTINMGSTQLGIANWIQEIITGLIIVVAVALDRYRMSRPAKMATE